MVSSQLIREARRRAGLSQAELARRLHTSQGAVARWESGRVAPSLETVERVAAACGLELELSFVEADPDALAQIRENLRLTPEERLEQLVRAVHFIEAGRAAMGSSASG